MMRRLVFAAALLAGCKVSQDTSAPAPMNVNILPPAYGENARAETVQKECDFDKELPRAIARAIPGAKVGGSADRELTTTIVRVQGAEPGWQGDISVILEGELAGGTTETRRFRFKQGAPPGVAGGMRGVCSGLDKVARLLADDIAAWANDASGKAESDQPQGPSERYEESSVSLSAPPESSEGRDVALDEILEE